MLQNLSSEFSKVTARVVIATMLATSVGLGATTVQADPATYKQLKMVAQQGKYLWAAKTPQIVEACPQIKDVALQSDVPIDVTPHDSRYLQYMIPIEGSIALQHMEAKKISRLTKDVMGIQTYHPNDKVITRVESIGGNIPFGKMLFDHLRSTPAKTSTFSLHGAVSVATLLLFAGKDRRTLEDTLIIVHAPRMTKLISGPSVNAPYYAEEDLPIGSPERAILKRDKATFKDSYKKASTMKLTDNCLNKLLIKENVRIDPKTALKLGFLDAVIAKGSGTMTVPYDDPRAVAHRAKINSQKQVMLRP